MKKLLLIVFLFFFIGFYNVFAAVSDDGNMASITWSSATNLGSYNVDSGVYQSSSASPWGAFTVAQWVGFFGSFTHIRMFETNTNGACASLTLSGCAAVATDAKDYWVSGSNWSVTDPNSPSTPTATSTIITNPEQNLFNGFIIFFLSFGFIIWFFRKNKK